MNHKIGNLFKGDKVIWMVLFMLCMISVVEVFSASSNLTYKSNNYIMPIVKHSATIIVGVFIAIVTVKIQCRYFKLATPFLIVLSFFTLLWVLFAGETINGANRVIEIAGQTFQPSEIAKGTMVLASAQILSAMQTDRGTTDKKAMRFILILLAPFVLLIGKENLSTAALLCFVIFLMMVIGRVPMVQLGKLLGVVVLCASLAVGAVMALGNDEPQENPNLTKTEEVASKAETKSSNVGKLQRLGTWKGRIRKFLDNKEVAPKDYDLDKDAQVAHANIAIVTSNIIGKGPGNSVERDFLAQAFSDFIYAIIIEEMGIGGAILVVFLYIVLLFRTARIANRCENNFPAFLAMGLALLLVVQAVFNMLVAVGLAPVTGQPLPLISKGGTSTIINCAYIGMILSISRSAKRRVSDKQKTDSGETPAVVVA
ncbi:MAG: FtsW/RodA/SpoVE family cell cycle protein [Prevotellaceae bacterium]|nr:FtsW/RodA/SpoVE family cell cycle protein [Prevotellaceae bacterium]